MILLLKNSGSYGGNDIKITMSAADEMCSLIHFLQIVFDECHKAKNLCPVGSSKPTKTGLAVLELQNKLPKARVVYASATGE